MELLGHMEILFFYFLRKPQSQEAVGEEGRDRVRRCWCCNWGGGGGAGLPEAALFRQRLESHRAHTGEDPCVPRVLCTVSAPLAIPTLWQ